MPGFFDTEIEFLKGVGPARGELLKKELGIFTFGDLLYHFPFRYIDRTRFYKINEVHDDGSWVQIKGKLTSLRTIGAKRAMRMVGKLTDDTGELELVWFKGLKWLKESLVPGADYVVFGKPSWFGNKLNIAHPEMELESEAGKSFTVSLQPFYNTTENCRARGLDSKGIMRLQKEMWKQLPPKLSETLPESTLREWKMLPFRESLASIHFPPDANMLKKAQFRLKFEELFYIQLELLQRKLINLKKYKGKSIGTIGERFNDFFYNRLPFPLTNAQKRVLKEIRADMGSGAQMNRLLQGDVGSGKTVVALMSMIMVLDNNYQACMMAPTEILAQQHFKSISELLQDSGITIGLLTGSTKGAERTKILSGLSDGTLDIVVGTHALIEDTVQFNNLGLVIIDEQHRFGVEQRARMWSKDKAPPHVLVMTATPIPRTLAMTLYGDLDVSVIDELPPGRKPIRTEHRYESSRLRLNGFLKSEIKKGRQVYIVYPLIEESEKLDLMNLQQGYESICRDFPLPEYKVSIVHGKMKAKDKDAEMALFVKGTTNIMVATTVIEVGVNVPNASVMVIESAERFGLAQLHQLRGRVGRGADQSYCILMTGNKLSNEARLRMDTMVRTNDGFEIAEVDMQLRGHGDIGGTQQSGAMNLRIADITKDTKILEAARKSAIELLNRDPDLADPGNQIAGKVLNSRRAGKKDWSRIS